MEVLSCYCRKLIALNFLVELTVGDISAEDGCCEGSGAGVLVVRSAVQAVPSASILFV